VIILEDLAGAFLAAGLEGHLVVVGLENDVAVGRLRVNGYRLAGGRAGLGLRVEGPEGGSAEDKHLVVNDVLAETRPAAPAKRVHALAFAEVGVPAQGLLIRRPAGLEPALRAEVVAVGVLAWYAVDAPAIGRR